MSKVWALTTRPGPATYAIGGSMGRQPDSTRPSFPRTHFGSEPRHSTSNVPSYSKGPVYAHAVSMGKQIESHRPSANRAHFGTSTREHHAIVYSAYSYKPH